MAEAPAPARNNAEDSLSISRDSLGHDILAALVNELRTLPDHFSRLNEENQQKCIERLKDKIRGGIDKAIRIIVHGELAAVPAKLEHVNWKDGLTCGLKIQRDAMYRHALSDAQGTTVLLVVTDATRWVARMDEVKAKSDQIDLFDGTYDGKRDQPGYRRDTEDRITPGTSWDDLKKSLNTPKPGAAETKPPEGESKSTEGDTPPASSETTASDSGPDTQEPPLLFGSASREIDDRAEVTFIQEKLAQAGAPMSRGALLALTKEQLDCTRIWAVAYVRPGCTIARPLWVPIPTPPDASAGTSNDEGDKQ
jgi:hypothetical protein